MMTKHTTQETSARPEHCKSQRGRGSGPGSEHYGCTRWTVIEPQTLARIATVAIPFAKRTLITAFAAIFVTGSLWAQNLVGPDVTAMSVEDLMNLQVSSVSKRSQKVADAAAAVFVITQEDIRHFPPHLKHERF